MAKPEAASRCRLLWPYSDKQLKASYLFSRQFLGIGEGKKDTQLLADQARKWEEECQRDIPSPLWADTTLNNLLGADYVLAISAYLPIIHMGILLPVLKHHDKRVEVWA